MADYNVVNPPQGASFTPPRFDASWLGDLPQAYYQGAAARRDKALAEAFPEGLPKDANGRVDYNELTNRVMKIGGPAAAGPMINTMMGYQIGEQAGKVVRDTMSGGQPDEPAQQPSVGGPRDTPHTGPAHLGARSSTQVADADHNSQGDNIRSLVTEHLPGVENPKLIQYLAGKLFPGDENGDARTLSADQAQDVVKSLVAYKSRLASASGPPGPSPAGMGQGVGDPAQPQTGGQPAAQPGPAAAASGVASTGQPGPGPAPSGPVAAGPVVAQGRAATPAPPAASPRTSFGGEAGVPPEFSWARRQQLDKQAKALAAYATSIANVPQAAKAAENARKAAEYLEKQVQTIDEYRSKAQLPTDVQKNTRDPLADPSVLEGKKLEITAGQKMFSGISAADRDASTNQHYIDIGRAALQDPRYGGGFGSDINQVIAKMRAAFGSDPNANLASELLTKTTAQSILNQTSQFRENMGEMGQNSGRIFQQQIQLMLDSSASLKGTPAGSRALLTIQERAGQYQNKIADMAQKYLDAQEKAGAAYPHLDRKFDRQVSEFLRNSPMFSKEEISNINLLASHHYGSAHEAGAAIGEGQTYWNTASKSYRTTKRAKPNG